MSVTPIAEGMNSEVWEIRSPSTRWALKLVTERNRPAFQAGLIAATTLEDAGLTAGRPIQTVTGDLSVVVPGGCAGLLESVDGVPLAAESPEDAAIIGSTLGHAHRLLRAADRSSAPGFDWLDPDAAHLDVESWVRPAIVTVLDDWHAVRHQVSTWGLLHGDPAPEVFLIRPDGDLAGVIDWASCFYGPILYDLASAPMYQDCAELLDNYIDSEALPSSEVEIGLPVMRRLRWGVQADYFARRLRERDLTGVDSQAHNRVGLARARNALTAHDWDR